MFMSICEFGVTSADHVDYNGKIFTFGENGFNDGRSSDHVASVYTMVAYGTQMLP